MPTEMTIEAAMIELNRLKSEERMEIDRERLAAAIGVMKDAAQFRIKREPIRKCYLAPTPKGHKISMDFYCPNCEGEIKVCFVFCPHCGQSLDWSAVGAYDTLDPSTIRYEPLRWRSL